MSLQFNLYLIKNQKKFFNFLPCMIMKYGKVFYAYITKCLVVLKVLHFPDRINYEEFEYG